MKPLQGQSEQSNETSMETSIEKSNEDELRTWRNEWQSLGDKDTFAAALVSRAAQDGKKMWRATAAEIAGVIASTAFCMWLMVRSRGAVEVVTMTTFVLVFNGVWMTYYLSLRTDLFSASGEGVETFVMLTRRRLAMEHRWIRFTRHTLIVLVATLVPWAGWFYLKHQAIYHAAPWRAAVGFGTMLFVLVAVYVWTRYKQRKLIEQEQTFETSVADANLN